MLEDTDSIALVVFILHRYLYFTLVYLHVTTIRIEECFFARNPPRAM